MFLIWGFYSYLNCKRGLFHEGQEIIPSIVLTDASNHPLEILNTQPSNLS